MHGITAAKVADLHLPVEPPQGDMKIPEPLLVTASELLGFPRLGGCSLECCIALIMLPVTYTKRVCTALGRAALSLRDCQVPKGCSIALH
jgi:hypothetical protein